MKIKIIGFKVGKSRPTANRTVRTIAVGDRLLGRGRDDKLWRAESLVLGGAIAVVLEKSDFISIRRVDE